MADQYIVVLKDHYNDINVYHFDEKRLFEWLNDPDYGDINILDKFPTQTEDPDFAGDCASEDDYYGSYCIADVFLEGDVYILKNGSHFKPEKVTHEKVETVTEYVPPYKARARKANATKAKRRAKK